jgi:hypothetical protein
VLDRLIVIIPLDCGGRNHLAGGGSCCLPPSLVQLTIPLGEDHGLATGRAPRPHRPIETLSGPGGG